MSILGAMNTAVSGLSAQSAAFSNISDNVANAQTVGFKGVNTSFEDYLTTSSALVNDPGTVVATPQYLNTVQGTISTSQNPLALAVSGQGFFDVSQATGTGTTGQTLFNSQQYFTRDGDFQLNSTGYLTNESGLYLNGWIANPTTGVLDKSNIKPIQVAQTVYAPVATQNMTMNANLPPGYHLGLSASNQVTVLDATGTEVQAPTSQVGVYDADGVLHQLTLTWTPTATSATQTGMPWALSITDTTNGADTPIVPSTATTSPSTSQLVTDQAALTTATDALTQANTTTSLPADQTTLTNAQATVASSVTNLTGTGGALNALATDVTAVQTARTAAASAAPSLNTDMAALAALAPGLQSAVQAVDTARSAATAAQAQVYQDMMTGATIPAADSTALTNATAAVATAVTALTTAATTADGGAAGPITAAAQTLESDWSSIDTANGNVTTAMQTLGTAVVAANTAATTTAATQLVTNWTTVDTATDQVAADQTPLTFAQTAVNIAQTAVTADWTAIQSAEQTNGSPLATFGANGTLQQLQYTDPTGKQVTIAATATNANPLAALTFDAPYPTSATSKIQPITLNLGDIGTTNGLTQFAASAYTLSSLTQDGVPPGSFSSISTTTSGDVYANYDNGQTRLIAQVPLATFGDADALQSQNGSAYTATNDSGNPSLQAAGTNGAGDLVTSSVESSNVDIASQFSQLIIAQQAYSANAKVVTTADQLMQTTINMKS